MLIALIITLFVSMFLTVPIAVSIAISTIVAIVFFLDKPGMLDLLAQAMVTAADNFALLAIPAFMLLGSLMDKGGLAESLISFAEGITRKMVGGLGAAGIIATMFFAAISGSGPAIVAALGTVLIPELEKRSYPRDYSASLLGSASIIGVIIPPSIPLIMYGVVSNTSITKLFVGGIIPGIIIGVSFIGLNYLFSKRHEYGISKVEEKKEISLLKGFWDAKWSLLMPVIVLGGIYGGIFTPTESAVVGVVYALFIGLFISKKLNWKNIQESLIESALLTAVIMFLVGGSVTFGRLLTMEQIPQLIANNLIELTNSGVIILMIIAVFLLITGMFIDTISNIILFTPIFLPVIVALDYDPVYFGVLMVIILATGYITPPVGVSLFVAQGVAGVSFEKIVKGVMPFLIVLLIIILLLIFFPFFIEFLPNML